MTAKDVKNLDAARGYIPPAAGISITSFPGEDAKSRVKAAVAISRNGFSPIPHIAARRLTSILELEQLLDQIRSLFPSHVRRGCKCRLES